MKTLENNFGVLRLALALLVVFGHFKILQGNMHPGIIFSYADLAVDAFFIVSGYLIYGSFDNKPDPGSFYIRRLFRIYPLYFVTVIAQGMAMAIIAGGIIPNIAGLLKYLSFNLVMANFLAHDLGGLLSNLPNNGINPSLWTLKVEVAFYLVMPVLWYLTRRFGNWFLAIMYISSTIFALVALHYGDYTIAKQLPGKLRFFAVGIALYRYSGSLKMKPSSAILVLALMFGICSMRSSLWLLPIYPLCVGMIVLICALRLPAFPISFDISYGIYLFHGPFIQFALLLGVFEDSYRFIALLIFIVCALAFLAERIIEHPGIDLGHRLSSMWIKRIRKDA